MDSALYHYFDECNRSQAEYTLAAMLRLYPPLRQNLPWAAARLKALAVAGPPAHHSPLPWLQCVEIAYYESDFTTRNGSIYLFELFPESILHLIIQMSLWCVCANNVDGRAGI